MKLKKEYQEILDNLDQKEKENVSRILQRTDAVASKNRFKDKSYQFVSTVRESLKHNFFEWLFITFAAALVLMLFLTVQAIWCRSTGGSHVWNIWFYNEVYLQKLHGHNFLFGIWQLIKSAGFLTIMVYIYTWACTAIGFFIIKRMRTRGNYAEVRNLLFDYLECRERRAGMNGFSVKEEREDMKKWAKMNCNYHFRGAPVNKVE